jgi:hypothetical protein
LSLKAGFAWPASSWLQGGPSSSAHQHPSRSIMSTARGGTGRRHENVAKHPASSSHIQHDCGRGIVGAGFEAVLLRHPHMHQRTCRMPGTLTLVTKLRCSDPWMSAHASTAPVSASGHTQSTPQPNPTHANFVMPAQRLGPRRSWRKPCRKQQQHLVSQ